jgi:dienelactone hydrolase
MRMNIPIGRRKFLGCAGALSAGAVWPGVTGNDLARGKSCPIAALEHKAQGQSVQTESLLGSLAPVMRSIQRERGFPLAYEHRGAMPVEEWRQRGRAEVERFLSFHPEPITLDVRVQTIVKRAGYETRRITFAGCHHYRVPAFLLMPTEGKPPYPGIVALHDHSGYFYHGKEKLVAMEGEHLALKKLRDRLYGGLSYADELAKRGFVVLVTDAFYWGERRIEYRNPPEDLASRLAGLRPEQLEYVEAVNSYLGERNTELNTWLAFCGISWMGIVNHDDRRSVDVLASLPEVDAAHIGCVGLSGGAYRATYLTGMDSRIQASAIVGWMTSLPTTLNSPYPVHAGLFDAFGLHAHLDHPDVASLAAPDCALFVQDCAQDRLFTRAGMEEAADKLRRVYGDLEHPERFRSKFYDVPHQFNRSMQAEVFDWLGNWLRPKGA